MYFIRRQLVVYSSPYLAGFSPRLLYELDNQDDRGSESPAGFTQRADDLPLSLAFRG